MLKFAASQTGLKQWSYSPAANTADAIPFWKEPGREAESMNLLGELRKTARLVHPGRGLAGALKRGKSTACAGWPLPARPRSGSSFYADMGSMSWQESTPIFSTSCSDPT